MRYKFVCPHCGSDWLEFKELTVSDVWLGSDPGSGSFDFTGTETIEGSFVCGNCGIFIGSLMEQLIEKKYVMEDT